MVNDFHLRQCKLNGTGRYSLPSILSRGKFRKRVASRSRNVLNYSDNRRMENHKSISKTNGATNKTQSLRLQKTSGI